MIRALAGAGLIVTMAVSMASAQEALPRVGHEHPTAAALVCGCCSARHVSLMG